MQFVTRWLLQQGAHPHSWSEKRKALQYGGKKEARDAVAVSENE
jgi:hypothetical protein